MLIYRRTSILESSAQTLVNTVNCVGVMGKGLAQAFKEREPDMYATYKRICDGKLLEPGKLWLWRGVNNWVLNFPTKKHWRYPSKIEWIEAGLEKFASAYEEQGIREISFPQLGCGNGGLDWNEVKPLMERYLSTLPIRVFIHDFTVDIGLPEHMDQVAKTLKLEQKPEASFDAFFQSLKRAVALTGNDLMDIRTHNHFQASIKGDEDLIIEGDTAAWKYEREDIRGVWVKLTNGLVTKERASQSVGGGGSSLLSLLSLLPQVRPIEIERQKKRGA